jgi:hypothetical protein
MNYECKKLVCFFAIIFEFYMLHYVTLFAGFRKREKQEIGHINN